MNWTGLVRQFSVFSLDIGLFDLSGLFLDQFMSIATITLPYMVLSIATVTYITIYSLLTHSTSNGGL